MEGIPHPIPRTVEEVFNDFKGRRAGLIKALTIDVEKFYQQCDPEKENLCLYGFPNETWEVNLPVEEVPPELPEPALGINFARDGMQEKDWLSLVAVHSDSWLLSVAFYFGARFGFGKSERKRLFQMINDVPTVFEVVTGAVKQVKEQAVSQNNSSKNKSGGRMQSRQPDSEPKGVKISAPKDEDESGEEEEEDEQGAVCGACGDNYGADEFWICCDVCERWFHGKCVKITPAKAEHIKQYKCPTCSISLPSFIYLQQLSASSHGVLALNPFYHTVSSSSISSNTQKLSWSFECNAPISHFIEQNTSHPEDKEEDDDEKDDDSNEDAQSDGEEAIVNGKGKGIARDDEGKRKLIEGFEDDDDDDPSDDCENVLSGIYSNMLGDSLVELDLDTPRAAQPGFHIFNDCDNSSDD
ncbi:PHD finger protein ALFIN-LIKE 6 [Abeliophyllum distichum]|uniref:PHD finger protein ALFIN-LIKE n=1 Tax=Abeliophyllum distichum TaxID=126358 RepID=A0ABD1RRW7_9LAMI